jgi:hypothetical protein
MQPCKRPCSLSPCTVAARLRAWSGYTVRARSDARLFCSIINRLARPCNDRVTTVHSISHQPCIILSPLRGEMHEGGLYTVSRTVVRAGRMA